MSGRNVIEFARYQQDRVAGKAQAIAARLCRHCGAALLDGENEDECSSAFNIEVPRLCGITRKFYAD
jgi:lipoate-protein ligase A